MFFRDFGYGLIVKVVNNDEDNDPIWAIAIILYQVVAVCNLTDFLRFLKNHFLNCLDVVMQVCKEVGIFSPWNIPSGTRLVFCYYYGAVN